MPCGKLTFTHTYTDIHYVHTINIKVGGGRGGGNSTFHCPRQYAWYQYGVITFKRLIHNYCVNHMDDIDLASDGLIKKFKSG